MNSQEAYKILGLEDGADKEAINNAFRQLAKKYHPDRNKDNPEAENKFKEINSAYQYLNNPQPEHNFSGSGSVNMQDFINQAFRNGGFGGFGGNPFQNMHQVPHSVGYVTITFVESVLGVEKELEIDQNISCNDCQGNGFKQSGGDCGVCKGSGQKKADFSRGNMVFIQPCNKCHGTGKNLTPCNSCPNQCGYTTSKVSVKVGIPGGVVDGNVLRIPNGLIKISVAPDPDMSLVEGNVVSNIEISLLEALKGVSKKVRTVKGEMNLKIPSKIKNSNSVQVYGYGVNGQGNHIFNVKVNYPENDKIEELIKILEK